MRPLEWDRYRDALLSKAGELEKLSPEALADHITGPEGSKAGHLDAKTRQLISLAVAVTTRCDGCVAVHSKQARKEGATREEIAEALGVAIAMNAGAALVYSTHALDAVDSGREAQLFPV
nr:carboxymuconolactone decarboxylase family protein [Mesorhizobium sp. WSM4875]